MCAGLMGHLAHKKIYGMFYTNGSFIAQVLVRLSKQLKQIIQIEHNIVKVIP